MNKTVIVTGGAGYIGSILCELLLKEGYEVLCLDNLTYGSEPIEHLWKYPNFYFLECDIRNYDHLDKILRWKEGNYHAMVHLASIVGDPACKNNPDLAKEVNLDASAHLLDLSKSMKIPRFIFASTCSNYGKSKEIVDENSPLSPISLYAKLKVCIEEIVLQRNPWKEDCFFPTVLRFATAYGLSPRMRFDLTVNEFTKELYKGNVLKVYGEQFWRPYCHVRDIARSILLVLNAPEEKVAYQIFNVGSTQENYTKKMIVDLILGQIPYGKVEYIHKEEDPRNYKVNFSKIWDFGFRHLYSVPIGIETILNALKNWKFPDIENRRYYNS